MPVNLPTEILDYVLTFLPKDIWHLRACSRSASPIAAPAERRLYAHIDLAPRAQQGHGSRYHIRLTRSQLRDLLQTQPHIAPYILSIGILIWNEDLRGWSKDVAKEEDDSEDTPPNLPNLLTFSFNDGKPSQSKRIAWRVLPSNLRTYMKRTISLESVEEVIIKRIFYFPLNVLEGRLNIKRISLEDSQSNWSPKDTSLLVPDLSPFPQLRFEHLSLHRTLSSSMLQIFGWLVEHPIVGYEKVSRLRSLSFRSHRPEDFARLQKLFDICATTLEEVSVDVDSSKYASSLSSTYRESSLYQSPGAAQIQQFSLNFAVLLRLRRLSIYTSIRPVPQNSDYHLSAVPAIASLLQAQANRPALSRLQEFLLYVTVVTDSCDSLSIHDIDYSSIVSLMIDFVTASSFEPLIPPTATLLLSCSSGRPEDPSSLLMDYASDTDFLEKLLDEGRIRVLFQSEPFREEEEE